jgi:hypothetical protein
MQPETIPTIMDLDESVVSMSELAEELISDVPAAEGGTPA